MADGIIKGRTIRLFLVDGTPKGILTAEIMNWTGRAVVAPRTSLPELMKRKEAHGQTGVYFLIGQDPEHPSKLMVYIGESDNVSKRIADHNRDEGKDWNRVCMFTSKDENLTKAHVRYLESRLIGISQAVKRATVANGTSPDLSDLPEPDIADMEFFIEQIRLVMPVLGLEFLRDTPKASKPDTVGVGDALKVKQVVFTPEIRFALVSEKHGVEAKATELDGEIIVFSGSTARAAGSQSRNSYRKLRNQLIDDGKLRQEENSNILRFTEDVSFNSPSAASAVILDRNDNGRTSWKVEQTGQTYQEWSEKQVEDAVGELTGDDPIYKRKGS